MRMTQPRAVVVDIEGTTTPISFVKDTLFPYARARIAAYVAAHPDDPAVAEARALAGGADVAAALVRWIDEDRKVAALKSLQGAIWEEGYRTGALKAPVYPDAAEALRAWHEAGIALAVYSSGSVAAQKLLFGHSDQGDLTGLFSAWFDLATGSKLEPQSYAKIAAALGPAPSHILFLSDHPGELAAAEKAGFRTIRVDRGEGPPPAPPGDAPTVRSFAEIDLEAMPAGSRKLARGA
jgi:enolase-phosphatase E1